MNVACNSPDTVSHRVSISLELQRLRTLLKIHSIELHAKLLRGCALARTWDQHLARGSDTSRVGPVVCVWVRYLARGSGGMRVGGAAQAISRGWRACYGVNAHVQWFACERSARSGAVVLATQITLPATRHCRRLWSRWFVLWAPRCLEA